MTGDEVNGFYLKSNDESAVPLGSLNAGSIVVPRYLDLLLALFLQSLVTISQDTRVISCALN